MSRAPVRLYLVRHGEVSGNLDLRFVGRSDPGLTARGDGQVEALARRLAAASPSAVWTSPLRRARETAERIAARHAGLEVQVEPCLREQDFGEWEGASATELEERGEGPRLEKWWADPELAPPGGESLAAVRRRCLQWVEEVVANGAGGEVVAVSHVGPVKILVAEALGLGLAGLGRLFLDPGSMSVVDWGERAVVRAFNCRDELPRRAALER